MELLSSNFFQGGAGITRANSINGRSLTVIIQELIELSNVKGASIEQIGSNYFDGYAGLGNANSVGGRDLVDILNEIIIYTNSKGGSLNLIPKDYFGANSNLTLGNSYEGKNLANILNETIDGVNNISLLGGFFLSDFSGTSSSVGGGFLKKYPIEGGTAIASVIYPVLSASDAPRDIVVDKAGDRVYIATRKNTNPLAFDGLIRVYDLDLTFVRNIGFTGSPTQLIHFISGNVARNKLLAVSPLGNESIFLIDLADSDNVLWNTVFDNGIYNGYLRTPIFNPGETEVWVGFISDGSPSLHKIARINATTGAFIGYKDLTGFTPGGWTFGQITSIAIDGSYLYANCGESWTDTYGALVKFNLSTGAYVSHIDLPQLCHQMEITGGKIYISDRKNGVRVIDIATFTQDPVITIADSRVKGHGLALY